MRRVEGGGEEERRGVGEEGRETRGKDGRNKGCHAAAQSIEPTFCWLLSEMSVM